MPTNGVEIEATDDRPDERVAVGMVRFGWLEFTEAEAAALSDAAIADQLVGTGASRLTAARIVEVARDGGTASRARPHRPRR